MEFKNKLDPKSCKEMIDVFDDMLDNSMEMSIGEVSHETKNDESEDNGNNSFVADILNKIDKNDKKQSNIFMSSTKTFDEKSLEEKMSDIYEEYKADTTITLGNIRDIAFRTAAIKGRWCSRMMAERVRYHRLKENLDTLISELGKMVDDKVKSTAYLTAKMNRDKMINDNEEVKKLRREMYESKQLQDYFTYIYESIGDLGYVVKNSLNVLELERGI